jgi:DHA1 family multidrug resistance protein-like MFS transporter
MDPVDRDLEIAEMEATPSGEPIERRITTHSTDSSDAEGDRIDMDRAPTQKDAQSPMDKIETAISRIQTGRSQHTTTVGSGIRSRQRESRRPMPPMGAGKPYPPPLPEREEYVVEFDGADDPMHAQNWPLTKK